MGRLVGSGGVQPVYDRFVDAIDRSHTIRIRPYAEAAIRRHAGAPAGHRPVEAAGTVCE